LKHGATVPDIHGRGGGKGEKLSPPDQRQPRFLAGAVLDRGLRDLVRLEREKRKEGEMMATD